MKPDIWLRIAYPLAFNAPVRGKEFPSEYCHNVGMEKLELCGYSMVKKL